MKLAVRDYKRDLKVLHMRQNMKWTFTQIADKLNISKARARQVYLRIAKERKKQEKECKEMGISA